MEIKVNKQAQTMLHQEEVQKVITRAITAANIGCGFFYHTKPTGIGLSSRELIEMVEKETNETVFGGYKCVLGDQIKFSIRD